MSQADIDQLASWRTLGARNSQQVVKLAPKILAAGGLGDTGESFYDSSPSPRIDGNRMVGPRTASHRGPRPRASQLGECELLLVYCQYLTAGPDPRPRGAVPQVAAR